MTDKKKAALGDTTEAALTVCFGDGILSRNDAAQVVPKALAVWQYCHGFASLASTAAKFRANPSWRAR